MARMPDDDEPCEDRLLNAIDWFTWQVWRGLRFVWRLISGEK